MVERLYENLLELISKRQDQDCNSTLCNLNELQEKAKQKAITIVIVHYVI